MVERVKAAIAEKMAPAIDARAPYAKVMFDMAARAAIEAMREPTEAMLAALIKNRPSAMAQDMGLEEQQYADEWREMHSTMIDAALAEKQP
jgi:hypothetical protein